REAPMLVGVPKEIKPSEFRVGLTPAAVGEYVAHGHQVLVETGAGAGIGATDAAYRASGATIAANAAEVFAKAGMIVKVKEPPPATRLPRKSPAPTPSSGRCWFRAPPRRSWSPAPCWEP